MRQLRKLRQPWILPEPYFLFDAALLSRKPLSFRCIGPPATGVGLFSKVAGYHSQNANSEAWKLLLDAQKRNFVDPPHEVNVHLHRIEHGYSEAAKSDNDDNPYLHAWIYPWEIVKDKLRLQSVFGADIYDVLILEALTLTKSQVRPRKLFESDEIAKVGGTTEPDELRRRFRALSKQERAEYDARSARKLEFCDLLNNFKTRPKIPPSPFQKFFKSKFAGSEGTSVQEKTRKLSKQWRSMTQTEKLQFEGVNISAKGRIHRESVLDAKTELVMDYIFGAGKVSGFSGEWRQWRSHVAGSWHYLDRIYFPWVVQRKGKAIEMR